MYRIVAADQKEYGPVDAGQIEEWIAQGRANGQTIARLDDGPWKPLSSFPEFASAVASAPVPSVPTQSPPSLESFPQSAAKTNVLAISGLALSVLGFLQCCTPFIAVLGLIFSSIGLFQINSDPVRYDGRRLAIAGIITSIVGLLIFAFLLYSGVIDELMRNMPQLDFSD